jgi:hypothetical protein
VKDIEVIVGCERVDVVALIPATLFTQLIVGCEHKKIFSNL